MDWTCRNHVEIVDVLLMVNKVIASIEPRDDADLVLQARRKAVEVQEALLPEDLRISLRQTLAS